MCGIIGILGKGEPAADRALRSLRRLEYRGYDSAGIATLTEAGLERRRQAIDLGHSATSKSDLALRRCLTHGQFQRFQGQ